MKMVRSLAKSGEIAKDVTVMPSGPMMRQSLPMLPGEEAPGKDWPQQARENRAEGHVGLAWLMPGRVVRQVRTLDFGRNSP